MSLKPAKSFSKKTGAAKKTTVKEVSNSKSVKPLKEVVQEVTEENNAADQTNMYKKDEILAKDKKLAEDVLHQEISYTEDTTTIEPCEGEACDIDNSQQNEEEAEEEEEEEEEKKEFRAAPLQRSTQKPGSPKLIAKVKSPRLGDILSPKRAFVNPKLYKQVPKLKEEDLLFDENTILNETLSAYEHIKAADILTWLKAIDAFPYYYLDDKGDVSHYDDPDVAECSPIETNNDIDEAFSTFECRHGILFVNPTKEVEFGQDENNMVPMIGYEGFVYIIPVLSSGSMGREIRFIQEFTIWGLIEEDEYNKLVQKDEQSELVAKKKKIVYKSTFRNTIKDMELIDPYNLEQDDDDVIYNVDDEE